METTCTPRNRPSRGAISSPAAYILWVAKEGHLVWDNAGQGRDQPQPAPSTSPFVFGGTGVGSLSKGKRSRGGGAQPSWPLRQLLHK